MRKKTKKFSSDDKKKLCNKIEQIKDKEHHIEIFRIITSNSTPKFTENSNGIWLDLNNLDDTTLNLIENYINNINLINENFNESKFIPYTQKEKFDYEGPKLNNFEKNIISIQKSDE